MVLPVGGLCCAPLLLSGVGIGWGAVGGERCCECGRPTRVCGTPLIMASWIAAQCCPPLSPALVVNTVTPLMAVFASRGKHYA